MSYFYIRACKKGHYEIDYKRAKPGHRCKTCGKQLADTCPYCGDIMGSKYYYGTSTIIPSKEKMPLPDKCEWCGRPYPWSEDQSMGPAKREWAAEKVTKIPVYATWEESENE
ncbi:MAG: DUF2321 domain-containing protein [Firmicutes bacterium]|nr:DUF2321 domain-containing protein [Bacillota bacterium]